MANVWTTNPMKFDTGTLASATYAASNDNFLIETGLLYSTQGYKIWKILIVDAATGDNVVLKTLPSTTLSDAKPFIDLNMETGDLNKVIEFPGGFWVKGLLPEVFDNVAKMYVYLK